MSRSVRSSLVAVLVIAVVVAGGWAARSLSTPPTPALTAALAVLPEETRVVGFTDWSTLRSGPVAHDDLGERDVATRSELYGFEDPMQDQLGWSVLDAEWEVYGQAPGGGALVVQLDRSVSAGDVEDGLEATGFTREDDWWTLGPAQLQDLGLSTILQNVRVLGREGLVVMTDAPPSGAAVEDVVRSGAPAVTRDRELVDVASSLAGSETALLERSGLGCATTAMPDDEARQQASVALDGTAGLSAYAASGRGLVDRGGEGVDAQDVTFALRFESPGTAREQASVRETVSAGPFIGRVGEVEDALRLDDVRVDAATTLLRFGHDPGADVIMTGQGPLLFASC
ncbi:hypothetical protein ACHAAC_02815 [Aeromicrobium sp. CF4.19]|uniref:hypothetical protein n=1 Tax=Aeromicrobium sp. CF4.19 TaxID=3373082 RepID=UPI003EE463ED